MVLEFQNAQSATIFLVAEISVEGFVMSAKVEKLRSRKLWITVASAAIIALSDQLGLSRHDTEELVKLVAVYLLAQGAHDSFGKKQLKYTPQKQRSIVNRNIRQSTFSLMSILGANISRIETMAVERANTLGLEEYGDKSFHYDSDKLLEEIFEELADAIFYNCIRMEQANRGITILP